MFWLWVLGRGLVHMLSELMTGPRLDDAVIAVLVLDPELVKILYSDIQMRLRPRQRFFSAIEPAGHCHFLKAKIKKKTRGQEIPQTTQHKNPIITTHPKSNKPYDSGSSR